MPLRSTRECRYSSAYSSTLSLDGNMYPAWGPGCSAPRKSPQDLLDRSQVGLLVSVWSTVSAFICVLILHSAFGRDAAKSLISTPFFKNGLNILSRDWVWLYMGFGLVIGFIEHLQNIITNNYDSLTELHTPKITVTTAHIKCYQSSLAVAP
jgi:hypothetical protein